MESRRVNEWTSRRVNEVQCGRCNTESNLPPSCGIRCQSGTLASVLDWLRRVPLRSGCFAMLAMTKERLTTTSSIERDCFGRSSLAMTAEGNNRSSSCGIRCQSRILPRILDWLRRAPLRSGCRAPLAMTKERLTTTSSIERDCFGRSSLAMTAEGECNDGQGKQSSLRPFALSPLRPFTNCQLDNHINHSNQINHSSDKMTKERRSNLTGFQNLLGRMTAGLNLFTCPLVHLSTNKGLNKRIR
jgi:hypothetical protein